VKRLVAVIFCVAACGGEGLYATAAPAIVRLEPAADAVVMVEPIREADVGVITFGKSYDPETLDIPEPLTRFKRTFPRIAWSADLAHGVRDAFVSWVVVRRTEAGTEETMFDVEEPVDDASVTNLANSGNLALHVDNVAGTYVMRYLNGREVLAEGIFTLVD
jgi:hypothetical protein